MTLSALLLLAIVPLVSANCFTDENGNQVCDGLPTQNVAILIFLIVLGVLFCVGGSRWRQRRLQQRRLVAIPVTTGNPTPFEPPPPYQAAGGGFTTITRSAPNPFDRPFDRLETSPAYQPPSIPPPQPAYSRNENPLDISGREIWRNVDRDRLDDQRRSDAAKSNWWNNLNTNPV